MSVESPLEYFMILGRNVNHDDCVWRTRMTTMDFLLLELSPFVLFFLIDLMLTVTRIFFGIF